jgi:hypothetical protein
MRSSGTLMRRVLDPILEGLGELGASDGCCRNAGLISESIVRDHEAAAWTIE